MTEIIMTEIFIPLQALNVPCTCREKCKKPRFHHLPSMIKELQKSFNLELTSHDFMTVQRSEPPIETKVGFHFFYGKMNFLFS